MRTLATLPAEWKPFLQERPTFSATLLEARTMLRQSKREFPPAVRNLFAMNLATRFPEACKNYARLYNQAPALFVTIPDLSALKGTMESQVTRLTEYMPLTEAQWARCPADERQRWQALKTWADRMAARIPANEEALASVLLDAVASDWPTVPERP
ncbi:MAG: hypothetical protein WCK89_22030, partial [bacterium]